MNLQKKVLRSQARYTTSLNRHSIIGSWRLLSCKHLRADGIVEYPFGLNPEGRLVYLRDGKMIVLITDPARHQFRSGQFFEATDHELANAARGCVAYSGQWKIRENEVVHDIGQSLFPNWKKKSLARVFRIDNMRLILTTAPSVIRGMEHTATLVWEKEV